MPIKDNDSRVKRTKKLIRHGLVELSKEKSISKITVKELTDHAEINRGTFYLHYKDVFDLVESLEKDLYKEFNDTLSSISSNRLLKEPVEVCEALCAHFWEHIDLYTMLMGENGDAKFTYKLGQILSEKVHEVFLKIFPNMNESNYDFAFYYGRMGLVGLIHCWVTVHPEWTPRQAADMWLSLTTLGLWGIINEEQKEVLINAHNSR